MRRANDPALTPVAKAHRPSNAVTCALPAALNTFTSPDGTFTVSGTVTGFFTPAN